MINPHSGIDDSNDDHGNIKKLNKSLLNYLIDLALAVAFISAFITGVIKFPGILNTFGLSPRDLPMYEISIIHDYSAILMGVFILAHLLLHAKWMKNMTVRLFRGFMLNKSLKKLGVLFVIILLLVIIFSNPAVQQFLFGNKNVIIIEGVGEFEFEPNKIETLRPDIFQPGHFSVFDMLVYLQNENKTNMKYHFDETMNTYVIDEINGKKNWWYEAYYDGGWPENNVFRIDHFPYKEKMYLKVKRIDESRLQRIYEVFRAEELSKAQNGGKVIIPTVIIDGKSFERTFYNVEVKPHNLRNDTFQDNVITAIDVIMTLGDLDLLSYELSWYNSIGTAEVKNYFVDKINGDKTQGRCGFVYEEGSERFSGFSGNHIHIPPDMRVLNSPEYMEWFWICV